MPRRITSWRVACRSSPSWWLPRQRVRSPWYRPRGSSRGWRLRGGRCLLREQTAPQGLCAQLRLRAVLRSPLRSLPGLARLQDLGPLLPRHERSGRVRAGLRAGQPRPEAPGQVSSPQVRRDAASRQEPLVKQGGGREFPAQERGQTNGRLGGLDRKSENGPFLRRASVRGLVLDPVKDQHPHPVLRVPGTAAVRLSVKDQSLGPYREVDQEAHPEGTVQLRVDLRVAVGKGSRRVPAVIVPGPPSGLLLRAALRVDLQFPFDQTQALADQEAPGQMRLARMRPGLAPLKA
jgi:hypothetical protein